MARGAGFSDLIKQCCTENECTGWMRFQHFQKFLFLKQKLKEWRKFLFQNVDVVKDLLAKIQELDAAEEVASLSQYDRDLRCHL